MRILGIDPGTARTGYGIIDNYEDGYEAIDFGCVTTKADILLQDRLNEIANDLEEILQKWQPDYAAVEEIFFSKNVKTAISVAHSRGVIMQKLRKNNIPTFSYNPLQIKRALCNDGKAQKQQMQKMVQIILRLDNAPYPDDTADALAIAICHGNFMRNNQLYKNI